MATEEVQALLAAHAPHFSLTAEGKVKCELNGHTFPARADALEAFVKCAGRAAAGGACVPPAAAASGGLLSALPAVANRLHRVQEGASI